jgi:hypothetical protein
VPKFGGEKALTKHEPIESGLRCSLPVEETNTLNLNVNDLVAENVAKLYASRVFLEETPRLKNIRVKKARATKRGTLGRAIRKLYNMESDIEPEKPLRIELDLYQMETY